MKTAKRTKTKYTCANHCHLIFLIIYIFHTKVTSYTMPNSHYICVYLIVGLLEFHQAPHNNIKWEDDTDT